MLDVVINARVFAPGRTGARQVVVGGGRILAVLDPRDAGAGAAEPTLAGRLGVVDRAVRIHDAENRWLVPGLIDNHLHLTGGGGEAGASSKVPALDLSSLTRAGVTSGVGVLGTDDTTRSTESLVTAVRALCDQGFDAWCHTGGYHLPPTTLTGSVRRDITFLDRVIGIGEVAISDHRSSQPTLDEILRLAADAHVAGLMTGKAGVLHLHVGDGPRGLDLVRRAVAESEIPARVFHPTHVNRRAALLEEAFELAALGCTIDVTAFPEPRRGSAAAGGDQEVWAPDAIELFWQRGLPPERLTVSSDGGGCLPTFDARGRVSRYEVAQPSALFECLRELLRRGHALEQALLPFTRNVADHLRLSDKGRIEPGYDADLVLLDTERNDFVIHSVMVKGHWHVLEGRVIVRGPFEEKAPSLSTRPGAFPRFA